MDKQSSVSSSFQSKGLNDYTPKYQPKQVTAIVKKLLEDMDFVPTGINPVNKALEDYIENSLYAYGVECKQSKRITRFAASLVEIAYHNCTLDEKNDLGLFTWLAIYVDEGVIKDPLPFREFGSRLLRHQPQLDPALTALTKVLDRMWDLYDPLAASAIFNSTLNFITGSCIEPELKNIPLKNGIERFPWYIRDLTGLAVGYSLLGFVKSGGFDMIKIIQALPDMNFWVDICNDLLSFHKEEMADETGTYVNNRAKNDKKSPYETCMELVDELKLARQNIYAVLADNPGALKAWRTWEMGYVEWHLTQERYRLKDLGITL